MRDVRPPGGEELRRARAEPHADLGPTAGAGAGAGGGIGEDELASDVVDSADARPVVPAAAGVRPVAHGAPGGGGDGGGRDAPLPCGDLVIPQSVSAAPNRALTPERASEMGRRSGESRRRRKEQREESRRDARTAVQQEINRLLVQEPRAIVEALMRTSGGAQALLAIGADLFAQQEPDPPVIVFHSPYASLMQPKPAEWLGMLRAGNLRRLEIELEVHSRKGDEASEDAAA